MNRWCVWTRVGFCAADNLNAYNSTERFHIFTTFLIILPTPNLHLKWSRTVLRTPITERAKLHIKYTDIKIWYKIDKFSSQGNKSKVVRGTVLT